MNRELISVIIITGLICRMSKGTGATEIEVEHSFFQTYTEKFTVHFETVNQLAASLQCKANGASLVNVISEAKNDILKKLLQPISKLSPELLFWTSGGVRNNMYSWANGLGMSYENWADNNPGTDNCVQLNIEGQFLTANCGDSAALICEKTEMNASNSFKELCCDSNLTCQCSTNGTISPVLCTTAGLEIYHNKKLSKVKEAIGKFQKRVTDNCNGLNADGTEAEKRRISLKNATAARFFQVKDILSELGTPRARLFDNSDTTTAQILTRPKLKARGNILLDTPRSSRKGRSSRSWRSLTRRKNRNRSLAKSGIYMQFGKDDAYV